MLERTFFFFHHGATLVFAARKDVLQEMKLMK